ncbi:hypothetical protein SUGI_0114910 [Cryptomeria japonica]|uniref:uncharacterized protein LOC131054265 n=1 Tax=Cryptomeria japonica TaxID=3369 RepID=UPI002408928E|nr:uncharacterized protein LOC131054265 [Cryptomeria japonica]GLJ09735.1 hypothetical protein SUGI_0114910 [Cryptomeria japonica]
MAVTHADLAIDRSFRSLRSKFARFIMFLCTFLGLIAFMLAIGAEVTRTEVTYIMVDNMSWETGDMEMKCMYRKNGFVPIACALGSLLAMGMAMGIGNAYICLALCSPPANDQFRPLETWIDSDSNYYKALGWQAAGSFLCSWISFTVASALLLVGIVVEAKHRERWDIARENCMVVRAGMFAAAGIVGLIATFMGISLYESAVQTEKLLEEKANMRREVMEATLYYTPSSPSPSSIQQFPAALPK